MQVAHFLQADTSIWARALCAKNNHDASSTYVQPDERHEAWCDMTRGWLERLPADTVPTVLAMAQRSIKQQLDLAPEYLGHQVIHHHLSQTGALFLPAVVLATRPTSIAPIASNILRLTLQGDGASDKATALAADHLTMLSRLERLSLEQLLPELTRRCITVAQQLTALTLLEVHPELMQAPTVDATSLRRVPLLTQLRSFTFRPGFTGGCPMPECSDILRALTALTALDLDRLALSRKPATQLCRLLATLPLLSLRLGGHTLASNAEDALWEGLSPLRVTELDVASMGLTPTAEVATNQYLDHMLNKLTTLQLLRLPPVRLQSRRWGMPQLLSLIHISEPTRPY